MGIRYYRNGQATALSAPVDALSTSIEVDQAASFPSQRPYTLIIDPDGVLEEVVEVTDAVGTTLTVVRGVDGSTASPHSAGAIVYHGVSARDHQEANAHINGTTNVHGVSGGLVGTAGDQSIAGVKTFTGQLKTTAGDVVATGGDQTIGGVKTFSGGLKTTAGGDVMTLGATQTVTGNKTFTGTETHQGTETHAGSETHSGTVTFSGDVAVGGANLNGPWNDYTPVRRNGSGGATLGVGNGTLTGRYKVIGGKTCLFEIVFVFGSTSAIGTNDYVFTLPFAPHATYWRHNGSSTLYDASAGKEFGKWWRTIGGVEVAVYAENGDRISGTGGGSPLAWAAGDEIVLSGSYELP